MHLNKRVNTGQIARQLRCQWSSGAVPGEQPRPYKESTSPFQVVQLDWINTEDGGHLLSVLCGEEVWIYAPVCYDVFVATRAAHVQSSSTLLTSLGEVSAPPPPYN